MTSLPPAQIGPKVALSEQIVRGKTRVDKLSDVKSLNCWGQDLADVSILSQMPNVEVLSLSVNQISTLRDFSQCLKLQELYLRKNEVAEVTEVQWLAHLPDLRVLWLSDNPCAEISSYRQKVLQLLPKLTKLDNDDVTVQDRTDAEVKPDISQAAPASLPVSLATDAQPALPSPGSNPVLEHVYKPAELQAALGTSPLPASSQAASGATCLPLQSAATAALPSSAPPALPSPAPPALPSPVPPALLPRSQASSNAGQGLSTKPRTTSLTPNPGCSSNVLYAVIALLGDLDESSLQIVRAEVEQRLTPQ